MEFLQAFAKFAPLWEDIPSVDNYPEVRPLLAHYTSISVLESIVKGRQIWMSNPLFMNDHEELAYGIKNGMMVMRDHVTILEACGSPDRKRLFQNALDGIYRRLEEENALDCYVLCFCRHEPDDVDGLLSMWRAYGGNGNGAALVIDTAKLTVRQVPFLILGKVLYGSHRNRMDWIWTTASKFAYLLGGMNLPDERLDAAAAALFERLITFALFTKHRGFREENEWRLVYRKEIDLNQVLAPMLDYALGPRGVQPKLKLAVKPIEGLTDPDISLEGLTNRILLGPSTSSPLAQASVKRMLTKLGAPELANKVWASTIPLRPS